MPICDTLIRNASVLDGSGAEPRIADVAIETDRIAAIGQLTNYSAEQIVEGSGHVLAPGFIDVHTHDDTNVIRTPEMLPKLSQGVTTVVVGNCGISASPVRLRDTLPDPMHLLGKADAFCYPTFASYVEAVAKAQPSVNVAALVGHTALRNNHMDRLDRTASPAEMEGMQAQIREALHHGALGVSSGLAYLSAYSSSFGEILSLVRPLAAAGAIYTTHLRSEAEAILEALEEAFQIGRQGNVPIVISHLKCAGIANWRRSKEVLDVLDETRGTQQIYWDCYPYTASSSTLDIRQVDERVEIMVTWSEPHPEMAGRTLAEIASSWSVDQKEAAKRLQPAGAIYHCMAEEDMIRILQHPTTMIGSDGLPNDPMPHPRLWGTFPRVLGYYSRERKLFPLSVAVHKMTGMPATRFGLEERGFVKENYKADLVLFHPEKVSDTATYTSPTQPAAGIKAIWVNGVLSYADGMATGQRAGRFLPRGLTRSFDI
jgi:N-acyl-D-aspartate/D-glutamate deacylase